MISNKKPCCSKASYGPRSLSLGCAQQTLGELWDFALDVLFCFDLFIVVFINSKVWLIKSSSLAKTASLGYSNKKPH